MGTRTTPCATRTVLVARCLLVWTALTSGVLALSLLVLPVTADLGARGFDDVLTATCAVVLLVCAGWAWLATTAVVLEALRTGVGTQPLSDRVPGVPASLRRLVLAACGVALAVGAAVPAGAAGGPGAGAGTADLVATGAGVVWRAGAAHAAQAPASGSPTGSDLDGLPMPDRPSGTGRAPGASPFDPRTAAEHVVVPGDTLWDVAEQRLGPQVDDAGVAAYVVRLHALNRAVVGVDPDLILPGQHLRLPPA